MYDITFCLDNFYQSFIVTSCSLFNEKHIMPVAFVIHECKFEALHDVFFRLENTAV